MKHIKKFEAFSMNEELLGIPSFKEIKAKVQSWMESNEKNPKFQDALNKIREEMAKQDPRTQDKLKSLASEKPEDIKAQVEPELEEEVEALGESFMINEGVDWKNILSKFFKVLGIGVVSGGLIQGIWACVVMTMSGTGYTEMWGSTAGHMGVMGMITILSAIVPLVISKVLEPEFTQK